MRVAEGDSFGARGSKRGVTSGIRKMTRTMPLSRMATRATMLTREPNRYRAAREYQVDENERDVEGVN
jgi:hypothetical protein